jgi:hypothetical protein
VAIFDHRCDARVSRPVTRRCGAPLRRRVPPATGVARRVRLCVFVDVTFDEALRRALDRDAGLLGRHEVERRYLGRYIPGQRIYAEEVRPRERADVVVVSEEPAAPALARVGGRVLSPRAGRPAR